MEIFEVCILSFTFIILTLSFLHDQRPSVGIVKCNAVHDTQARELNVTLRIKNTGKGVANHVRSQMTISIGSQLLSLEKGESKIPLFPGQRTSGTPKFNNIGPTNLTNPQARPTVKVVINYEQLICCFWSRKFKTVQTIEFYNAQNNSEAVSCAVVSGHVT